MNQRIIKNLFSFALNENANFLAITSNDKKMIFDFFLPLERKKTLSLPIRYKKEFFKQLYIVLNLKPDELCLKKQNIIQLDSKKEIDLKTSVIPGDKDDKIIFEFNQKRPLNLRLSQLGLKRNDLIKLKSSLQKTSGLIILNGKEKTGTSTTLLACLNYINKDNKNIVMIGRNTDLAPKGISLLNEIKKINQLSRYQADIIAIDEIKSPLELAEVFKLTSQGKLVVIIIKEKKQKDLATYIQKAPWPKKEKIANLNLVIYQKLQDIETNNLILENKQVRKNIGRFKIIYSKK